jgi:hypothetical protein
LDAQIVAIGRSALVGIEVQAIQRLILEYAYSEVEVQATQPQIQEFVFVGPKV